MNIKKALKSFFSLKKYKGDLKLSPLILDTAISVFTGLFLFLWSVFFFSNPLYQQSLFMKLRNLMIPEDRIEESLSSITCIGIDPESQLTLLDTEGTYTSFDLIALALEEVKAYAVNHPEKRVVTGIDFVFGSVANAKPFKRCISALSGMPENMFVVLGSALLKRPDTVTTLRISLIEKDLLSPLLDKDPSLEDRIFMGNIHVDQGNIRSGFDNSENRDTVIGYTPVRSIGRTIPKNFFSLPLSMFIVGEVMEKTQDGRFDFYTDFAEGISGIAEDSGLFERLTQKTGKSFQSLSSQVYYNFFTGRDIAEFSSHYIWLSGISPVFENSLGSLDNYLNQPSLVPQTKKSPVEYIFIAPAEMPDFLLSENEVNDIILTPASDKDPFTYKDRGVLGVTSHITALSNLRNGFYIEEAPQWIQVPILLALAGSIFLYNFRKNLGSSVRFTLILILLFIVGSFVLFLFGIILPVTFPIGVSFITFGVVAIIRFLYTSREDDLYDTVAVRVFSPALLLRLKEDKSWREPRIFKHAIVMTLFPRRLPDFGRNEQEALRYTQIYDSYISGIFKIIERNEGNHLLLSTDGLLGFWNIPEEDEENPDKAFACARECLEFLPKWQDDIRSRYEGTKNGYIASFDICLHHCECYAGCVGGDKLATYSLSGSEVNFAIEVAQFQITDKTTTLILSSEFQEELGKKGLFKSEDYKKTVIKDRDFYSWKKAK